MLDSAQYHTAPSQKKIRQNLTPCSIILRGVNKWKRREKLRAVWYCAALDSGQYDTAQSLTPRSLILRGVKFRAVWYCAESQFTARSQLPFLQTFAQAFKGTVPQKQLYILITLKKGYIFHFCTNVLGWIFFWLSAVSYCAESVFLILKYEYLGENKTEFKNILTHWSVDQAGSNDEKNWGSKISLDCPFKKHHMHHCTV